MKQMKSLFFVFALLLCSTLLIPPVVSHAANPTTPEPKTSPPPGEMYIEGFFDPSFNYLDQGDSNILDKGNQTAEVSVSTTAKQTVASIGATIYLEKWTGTVWIQVGSQTISASNKMLFNGYSIFNTISGYYYRARTVHWVSHNGVYEQGERITNTILTK
jgi:hypothetical protein